MPMFNIFLLTTANQTASHTSENSFNGVWQFINVAFVLMFTIGLIYLFSYLAKKLKMPSGASKNINVIEYRNIGNNNNLVIVNIGEKYMLLSSNKDKVAFIADLSKNDIAIDNTQSDNKTINFKDIFDKSVKKDNNFDKKE